MIKQKQLWTAATLLHILPWDLKAYRLRYFYYERTGGRALLKDINREFKKPQQKRQWKRRKAKKV